LIGPLDRLGHAGTKVLLFPTDKADKGQRSLDEQRFRLIDGETVHAAAFLQGGDQRVPSWQKVRVIELAKGYMKPADHVSEQNEIKVAFPNGARLL
jgi:hypothetical protein